MIEPPVAISSSSTMARLPAHVADDRVDHDLVVGLALLAAGRDRNAQQAGEQRRRLGVAEVGRDDDGVGEVAVAVVVGELADRGEVVDRRC